MKKAFTLLELVVVILIIGILAAVVVPRTNSSKTAEAAIELISNIRYTQHLAMIDDKYGDNKNGVSWYLKIWQIRFNNNSYSVVSDNNTTFAKDPLSKENINNINLLTKYGVKILNIQPTRCDIIGFDHMGRPIIDDNSTSPVSNIITSNCNIKLSDGTQDVNISIEKETGYAKLIF